MDKLPDELVEDGVGLAAARLAEDERASEGVHHREPRLVPAVLIHVLDAEVDRVRSVDWMVDTLVECLVSVGNGVFHSPELISYPPKGDGRHDEPGDGRDDIHHRVEVRNQVHGQGERSVDEYVLPWSVRETPHPDKRAQTKEKENNPLERVLAVERTGAHQLPEKLVGYGGHHPEVIEKLVGEPVDIQCDEEPAQGYHRSVDFLLFVFHALSRFLAQ